MFFLGLIAAICYVPGLTGASIPTQWPFLSVALLPVLWKSAPKSAVHKVGLAFVAYAIISLAWATTLGSGVLGLWYVSVWAMAFWLGATSPDLRPLWSGLAYGVVISCFVAMFQALGWHDIPTNGTEIAGLYFNSTVLGAVCGLILVACLCHRLWWPTPFLLGGLLLSNSRGAVFILIVGLAARLHWLLALTCALCGFAIISHLGGPSDLQRLEIWGQALRHLTLWGRGPDSFNDLYAMMPNRPYGPALFHLEFAHNDYLQLVFEYGIGATLLLVPFAASLTRTSRIDFPILAAFATLALFYFPLYAPLLAFIGCTCAGHLLRPDGVVLTQRNPRRQPVLQGHHPLEPILDIPRRPNLPMVHHSAHTEA